jgi:dTDP-4-dehydrorhamnose 3,5-epimerase
VVDLRPGSPTYLGHAAVRLDEDNRRALLVPAGAAHGFLTLADGTEVFYQMSAFHRPEAARGARWDDPAFAIPWPAPPAVISERDRSYPDFRP